MSTGQKTRTDAVDEVGIERGTEKRNISIDSNGRQQEVVGLIWVFLVFSLNNLSSFHGILMRSSLTAL